MRTARWAVVGVAVALVVVVAAVAYAAGQAKATKVLAADVVRAKQFEVVDADGKVQAVLGLRGDGGATLDLSDARGLKRATLTLLPDAGPVLVFNDAQGEERATLTVGGGPSLTMRDKDGKVLWQAP